MLMKERAIARATEVVNAFPELYERHWLQGMRAKLGLVSEDEADLNLATGFLTAMEGKNVDYTLAFRYLADAALGRRRTDSRAVCRSVGLRSSGADTGGRGLRARRWLPWRVRRRCGVSIRRSFRATIESRKP